MLSEDDFDKQVRRMVRHWGNLGERHFSGDFQMILYKAVSNFDSATLQGVVDDLISHQRQVPTMLEIGDTLRRVAMSAAPLRKTVKAVSCSFCNGYGYYVCEKPKGGAVTAFCGACETGNHYKTRPSMPLPSVTTVEHMGYTIKRILTPDTPHNLDQYMPAPLGAVLIAIDHRNTEGSDFARRLRYNGITQDGAWTVYTAAKERRLNESSPQSIIRRVRARDFKLSDLWSKP